MPSLTHQDYVNTLKSSAIAAGKKALISTLTKKLPWLFVPVLGPIVTLIIGKLVEILIEQTEFAIFFQYIDMRVDSQGRDFTVAAERNYKAQLSGTPEEKIAAEKNLIAKFRAFVILGS